MSPRNRASRPTLWLGLICIALVTAIGSGCAAPRGQWPWSAATATTAASSAPTPPVYPYASRSPSHGQAPAYGQAATYGQTMPYGQAPADPQTGPYGQALAASYPPVAPAAYSAPAMPSPYGPGPGAAPGSTRPSESATPYFIGTPAAGQYSSASVSNGSAAPKRSLFGSPARGRAASPC